MLNVIVNFFFCKNKRQKTCYTYLGPNREYKSNSDSKRELLKANLIEIKKPSALSKYFINAESLFGNDKSKSIV